MNAVFLVSKKCFLRHNDELFKLGIWVLNVWPNKKTNNTWSAVEPCYVTPFDYAYTGKSYLQNNSRNSIVQPNALISGRGQLKQICNLTKFVLDILLLLFYFFFWFHFNFKKIIVRHTTFFSLKKSATIEISNIPKNKKKIKIKLFNQTTKFFHLLEELLKNEIMHLGDKWGRPLREPTFLIRNRFLFFF